MISIFLILACIFTSRASYNGGMGVGSPQQLAMTQTPADSSASNSGGNLDPQQVIGQILRYAQQQINQMQQQQNINNGNSNNLNSLQPTTTQPLINSPEGMMMSSIGQGSSITPTQPFTNQQGFVTPPNTMDSDYQKLLQFLQALNQLNLQMNNNQMPISTPPLNSVSTSVYSVTPLNGPVQTVTKTVQVPVMQPRDTRFSEALLDYLRSHVNELRGDFGRFIRSIIARHDAQMERLRSEICAQTTNNDWGEKGLWSTTTATSNIWSILNNSAQTIPPFLLNQQPLQTTSSLWNNNNNISN